jgi:hypothetical protein
MDGWPTCKRHGEPFAMFCDVRFREQFERCRSCATGDGHTPCLVRDDASGSWIRGTIDQREHRQDGWWARVWWADEGNVSASAHWVPFGQLVQVL